MSIHSLFQLRTKLECENFTALLLVYQEEQPQSEYVVTVCQKLQALTPSLQFAYLEISTVKHIMSELQISCCPCAFVIRNGILIKMIESSAGCDYTEAVETINSLPNPEIPVRMLELVEAAISKSVELAGKLCEDSGLIVASANISEISQLPIGVAVPANQTVSDALRARLNAKQKYFAVSNGELIVESDNLMDLLCDEHFKRALDLEIKKLDDRIYGIVKSATVVVFGKGSKEKPYCKYSKQIRQFLLDNGVEYDWFDVFSDYTVRERVKSLFSCPTFPQLYLNGELIGGNEAVADTEYGLMARLKSVQA